MSPRADLLRHGSQRACMLIALLLDAVRLLRLCLRPSTALAAENLFLRTQLALYQERQVKPRRATNATRLTLVWLAQWFDWQPALTLVTRRRSNGGSAKVSDYCGATDRVLDAHPSRWHCKDLSARWDVTT